MKLVPARVNVSDIYALILTQSREERNGSSAADEMHDLDLVPIAHPGLRPLGARYDRPVQLDSDALLRKRKLQDELSQVGLFDAALLAVECDLNHTYIVVNPSVRTESAGGDDPAKFDLLALIGCAYQKGGPPVLEMRDLHVNSGQTIRV